MDNWQEVDAAWGLQCAFWAAHENIQIARKTAVKVFKPNNTFELTKMDMKIL